MRNPRTRAGRRRSVIPDGERACLWMQAGVIASALRPGLPCERCPLDAALRHEHGELAKLQLSPGLPSLPERRRSRPARGQQGSRLSKLRRRRCPERPGATRPHLPTSQRRSATERGSGGPVEPADRVPGSAAPLPPWTQLGCTSKRPTGRESARRFRDAHRRATAQRRRPASGAQLRRGRPCAWIDLVGGTLTVLAPISGTVIETNAEIAVTPALLESDPFGRGWLFAVQPSDSEARPASAGGCPDLHAPSRTRSRRLAATGPSRSASGLAASRGNAAGRRSPCRESRRSPRTATALRDRALLPRGWTLPALRQRPPVTFLRTPTVPPAPRRCCALALCLHSERGNAWSADLGGP